MNHSKLVIIGGDAAGMSAASKVRRTQPDREIVVFERGEHTSYSACGMPYYISGDIQNAEQLIARTPEEFRSKHHIDVLIFHEVIRIDTRRKSLEVKDLKTGRVFTESYGDLLIATGASPVHPPFPGVDSRGVFSLSILRTGLDVFDHLEAHHPKTAVVVGGGYIGIEMAEALLARKMNVTLIDAAPQLMTTMDTDMALLISDYMNQQGVQVYLDEKLTEIIEGPNGDVSAVKTSKQTLHADFVIMAIGVLPNSTLAKQAGLKLGMRNAIAVNKRMQTSAPGVWAAGDCAESFHLVTRQQTHIALGTVANKHGLVAGTNLSGGDAVFPGVLGTAITKMNELEIARTGLSEKEAILAGMDVKTATISSNTRAGYYPGSGKISVKLVAESSSGRILGGQIVGFCGAGKRIDTIAAAITGQLTAQHLVDMDLSYAPPFSPVWDPVQTCARRLV